MSGTYTARTADGRVHEVRNESAGHRYGNSHSFAVVVDWARVNAAGFVTKRWTMVDTFATREHAEAAAERCRTWKHLAGTRMLSAPEVVSVWFRADPRNLPASADRAAVAHERSCGA
jgi:hypothetical protein